MNAHSLLVWVMGKRSNILNATEALLAERGFYGISMKLIAETADMAAGTIYRYFENKEALLFELHKHIRNESSQAIFAGWQDNLSAKQKYDLLWHNTFNAVLDNPKRLNVVEMLYFIPNINRQALSSYDALVFEPLIDFYQQGIDEGRFYDWKICALIALSFDSAINLAKKVLKEQIEVDQELINNVRNASWLIIQKP